MTVASSFRRRQAVEVLHGIELRRLSPRDESIPAQVLGALGDAFVLLVTDPPRLRKLVRAARPQTVRTRRAGARETVRRWRRLLRLAGLRPDVVHFEWESAAVSHLPLFEVWDCPVVVSCHGAGVHVFPHTGQFEHWTQSYRTIFGKAAVIRCVSEAVKRDLVEYDADPARIRVIPSAVDTSVFRPSPLRRADRDVLRTIAIGDLIWLKGHDYLLQATAFLLEDGVPVELDIVGGDPAADSGHTSDRGRLLFTIHALGLEGRVRLLGRVGHAEVRDRLRAADVLVHGSLSEGIPTAVLEAMACALPVVVTDAGGTREAVTDGVEGWIVPRRDPRAIATALRALWEDSGLRARMGRAGRARVEDGFALTSQVERFRALYEEVVGASPTGPR